MELCLWECKPIQACRKQSAAFLSNETYLSQELAVPGYGMLLEKLKHGKACTYGLRVTLFMKAPNWKQPTCLSTINGISCLWSIWTTDCFLARKNKVLIQNSHIEMNSKASCWVKKSQTWNIAHAWILRVDSSREDTDIGIGKCQALGRGRRPQRAMSELSVVTQQFHIIIIAVLTRLY